MFAVDYGRNEYNSLSEYNSDNAILIEYYKEVGKHPLLSKEEETELGYKSFNGDKKALEKLITCNLRLVISIAIKYIGRGISLMDLIQEGNIGLIESAKKFNPMMNCRFATYATYLIKQIIIRALDNKSRMIRMPIHISIIYNNYKKVVDNYKKIYEEEPTIEEVSKIINPVSKSKIRQKMSKRLHKILSENSPEVIAEIKKQEKKNAEQLAEIIKLSSDPISFDMNITADGDLKIGDTIADNDCYREYLDNEEIKDLMSILTDEEKNIINWRYGLNNTKKYTLEEISQKLGYSKERIRQKENTAIEKLKIRKQYI